MLAWRRVVRWHAGRVRWKTSLSLLGVYFCVAFLFISVPGELGAQSWRTASRAPAGLAPDPASTPDAVVQVYAARTISWRGYFGVHTWIAVKPTHADSFTVYELMGWQTRRTGNGVRASQRAADGYWYGNRPHVLSDVRGPGVDVLIDRIRAAVASYPHGAVYHVWPGPNSNTFTAHVLRAVPELRVDLPANAIGKDYLDGFVARTPSGTGAQFNLFGVAGLLAGWAEGVELNVIGLTFGVNPVRLALKFPLLGNLGLVDVAKPRMLKDGTAKREP
jgi:hypothetical protein